MSFGTFLFRDIMQYIMPTLLAVSLFSPYLSLTSTPQKDSIEILGFVSILAGYFVSLVMTDVALFVYKRLPVVKKAVLRHRRIDEWMKDNWDYGKFFYNMPNDDREYTYLTDAYKSFYLQSSFYFLIYFAVNIATAVNYIRDSTGSSWYCLAFTATTPLLFGYSVQTWVSTVVSATLFWVTFKSYLVEDEVLFFPNLLHDQFARKYQRDGLDIAKSVWGKVICAGNAANLEVELVIIDKRPDRYTATTDEEGLYQFKGVFESCKNKDCIIRVIKGATMKEVEVSISEKTVPCFEIKIP